MDDRIQVCGGCGRTLVDATPTGPAIGLIEDGTLLCRTCATEADRRYETPDLPPLDLPPLDAA